ncbi:MAG TPA: MgtC/SapB family protein [Kofleriaceae bacterium]|nr:MgtC/SapB family protein [Kofleriaceae bacterium]
MSLDGELVVRIVVGTILGGIIGYERDIHGRPAGLRTHAVVALASATFMVVSTHLVYFQSYRAGDLVEVDASRIAASVVSGIGFLAGGAILRNGITVQGLTTAAGLWLVAAIGLCSGAGMYVESVVATLLGIVTLTILRRFEDKDDRVRRRLALTLADSAIGADALIAKLAQHDIPATLEGWSKDTTGSMRHLTLSVRLARSAGEQDLVAVLEIEPGITKMQLDPAA